MKYDVWVEGFAATGQSSIAQFMGTFKGDTFEEAANAACKAFFSEYNPSLYRGGDGQPPSYWGCRMFDNEMDARKSFG